MRLSVPYLTHQMERLLNHFIFREFLNGVDLLKSSARTLQLEAHGAALAMCHHLMVSCSALWCHKHSGEQEQSYQLRKS